MRAKGRSGSAGVEEGSARGTGWVPAHMAWLRDTLGYEVLGRFAEMRGTLAVEDIAGAVVRERVAELAQRDIDRLLRRASDPSADAVDLVDVLSKLAQIAPYVTKKQVNHLDNVARSCGSHEADAVRGGVAYLLGRSKKKDKDLANQLLKLRNDDSPYVRSEAADALVSMFDLQELPPDIAPEEAAYQARRDHWEQEHEGEHIAILRGHIVAHDKDLRKVLAEVHRKQKSGEVKKEESAYVRRVGQEVPVAAPAPGPYLASEPREREQDGGQEDR